MSLTTLPPTKLLGLVFIGLLLGSVLTIMVMPPSETIETIEIIREVEVIQEEVLVEVIKEVPVEVVREVEVIREVEIIQEVEVIREVELTLEQEERITELFNELKYSVVSINGFWP